MTPSILADFAAGRVLPEQWIGLFIVAVIVIRFFVLLVGRHLRDTRDESRTVRGGE